MISARREALIWLQLLGAAALPLELLLLLLLLSAADPGPAPALERLLAWAIGALAPAVLLWKRPGDPFSLLLIQAPRQARSTAQRTVVAAPTLIPRLAGMVGAVVLLPALWWIDASAALAGPMAPLPDANRLVDLLLSLPLLAVMVWQMQQLAQALNLLLRSDQAFQSLTPLSEEQMEAQRLSLGLPLLLLEPLLLPSSAVDRPVAVEPEQPSEQADRSDLDQEVG